MLWKNSDSRTDFNDPLWLIEAALKKLNTMWVCATYPFASVGRKVSFHYTARFSNTGLMQIGNTVKVDKDAWVHVTRTAEDRREPVLIVEDNCLIARRCHIMARNRIHLERDVWLSASVLIQDHGHAHDGIVEPVWRQGFTNGGTIRIGQGSWIGQGAVITCEKGELVLGRNCVVAANAVVVRSAPPYSVLAGNPARIVKQFNPIKGAWVLGSTRSEAAAAHSG